MVNQSWVVIHYMFHYFSTHNALHSMHTITILLITDVILIMDQSVYSFKSKLTEKMKSLVEMKKGETKE